MSLINSWKIISNLRGAMLFGAPFLFGGLFVRTHSKVTDRTYVTDDMVYLTNPVQIAKYLKHGATLYDLLENDGKLVGVFSRRETKKLYEQWQNREI